MRKPKLTEGVNVTFVTIFIVSRRSTTKANRNILFVSFESNPELIPFQTTFIVQQRRGIVKSLFFATFEDSPFFLRKWPRKNGYISGGKWLAFILRWSTMMVRNLLPFIGALSLLALVEGKYSAPPGVLNEHEPPLAIASKITVMNLVRLQRLRCHGKKMGLASIFLNGNGLRNRRKAKPASEKLTFSHEGDFF